MPLFDEALYMRAYYLSPHKVEKMELESHSSGLTDVTPVIPHAAEFVHEAYEKSKGRNLQFFVNVKDADYVIVAHHYYNGFQYNPDSRKYESDGGVHILHPTGELIVIFDLSALDYRRLLKSDPKLFIRNKAGETPQLLKGSYENGMLTSQTIKDPPVGAHIFWDWEWSSEAQS